MPITNSVYGDLIDLAKKGRYTAIAHGCNCHNTMGSGIAPLIAKAFPIAKTADNNTTAGDPDKLGTFSVGFDKTFNLWVVNMYTQFNFGKGLQLSYSALSEVFKKVNNYYRGEDFKLGIPMIGAGLAGGHWDAISTIINLSTPDIDIELVVYNG